MGLAPYGEPIYIDQMRDIVRVQRDGTFELNLDYFTVHTEGITMLWDGGEPTIGTMYSEKLISALGEPRQPRTEITKKHQNIATSLQAMLEEAEFALVNKLNRETGQKPLCMAGGVALNSAFNGKVLPQTAFENIFVQLTAADAGNALGAANCLYHVVLGQPRSFVLDNAYTGPQYENDTIEAELKASNIAYSQLVR